MDKCLKSKGLAVSFCILAFFACKKNASDKNENSELQTGEATATKEEQVEVNESKKILIQDDEFIVIQEEAVSESAITVVDAMENMNRNDSIFSSGINIDCKPSERIEAVYQNAWSYSGMHRSDIRDTNNITGLFCENDGCYLKHTKISFIDSEDDCGGDSTLALMSGAKFLFSNFTGYNKDKIQSIPVGKDENGNHGQILPPNKKFIFDYGNKQYEFETFGKIKDNDESMVENYSLFFSEKGTPYKQAIVKIKNIEDQFVRVLFIGDLDGDGKPDIILDASGHYESRNILVFLSSTAKAGEYLRCEAKKGDSFAC
jgi:hypothetical protein